MSSRIGPRAPTTYRPDVQNVQSGEGAASVRPQHRPHNHHHTRPQQGGADQSGQAQQGQQQQQVMQQLMQVLQQLVGMLSSLFGGTQGANPAANGNPGVTGINGSAPGGSTSSPSIANNPGMPDLTGGVNGVGQPGQTAPGAVPYINQYNPSGSGNGYSNGAANCGPASMAMIARSLGQGAGMSDAQLINQLGAVGGTTAAGSSVNGIIAMAQEMGQPAVANQGADTNFIAQSLAAGKKVVANGDYYAEPGHANGGRTSGHYLVVDGQNADGSFHVEDPADPNLHSMTAAQLSNFLSHNNVNGGYSVAIG